MTIFGVQYFYHKKHVSFPLENFVIIGMWYVWVFTQCVLTTHEKMEKLQFFGSVIL